MAHHILDFLRGAIVHYGYWAIAVALLLENTGIPVPGETVLLLASFLAYSEHDLQLSWIIVVGTIAATLGDNLGYAIGFRGGRPLLERYRELLRICPATLERVRPAVCAVWRRGGALRPLCVWFADRGWSYGRRAAHALEKISAVQLSGSVFCGSR